VAGEQINFKPHFHRTTLPCEGEVGDLLVMTRLSDGEPDHSAQGLASLWFCTKTGHTRTHPATWKRVQLQGDENCSKPVPDPPQDDPPLQRG
jgi:hypothetical protein